MTSREYQLVLYSTDDQWLTLDDLARHADVHPALIEQFVEFGLLTPVRLRGESFFDASALSRLRTVARLRHGLGINLAGISVILDLVDKLCALQRENQKMRNRA